MVLDGWERVSVRFGVTMTHGFTPLIALTTRLAHVLAAKLVVISFPLVSWTVLP